MEVMKSTIPVLLLMLLCHQMSLSKCQRSLSSRLSQQGRSLVLVGGGLEETNAEVYNKIVELMGGRGNANIGIVTSASADPNDSFQYYRDLFLNTWGAATVLHVNVSIWDDRVAQDPHLVQQIRTLDGFFFGGGDQSRSIQSMFLPGRVDSPVLAAIRERFEAGATIAGSSAGSACQPSSIMVTGGTSYKGLRYGAEPIESSHRQDGLTYNQWGGLGFLDGYIIDTHFANRGREGRLIRLISDTKDLPHGVPRGLGIDENTALVITQAGTPQAQGEVLGERGVTFFDLTSSFVDTSQNRFNIRDVYLSYLTHGDVYHFDNHSVDFASDKINLRGNEDYDRALTSDDVFYGESRDPTRKPDFVRVATSLFDARFDSSSWGETYERNPRFRVEMSRANSQAEGWVKRIPRDFHASVHSYKHMYVAIHAV